MLQALALLCLQPVGALMHVASLPPARHVAARPPAFAPRAHAPEMGVPKFFRWLTERFPQINRRISQGRQADDYVDNFYLDMNGIIHTCTHGDSTRMGETLTEAEMVERIFQYTDRLIKIVRPRKVCYLAIDGVAPRAKMNQQRSRRYRAPREAMAQAAITGDADSKTPPFDSNCITPGTEFLAMLGERYKTWIEEAQADPNHGWCHPGLTVVFSGSDVVGEGEHKIMDFIRDGRKSGEMAEEARHCMYGLDADLIMLGLVTHAPKFCLLRERQKFQQGRNAPRGRGGPGERAADSSTADEDSRDFVFLEVEMLHSLMAGTLRPRDAPRDGDDSDGKGGWSDERLVDDFVFMCMLVGNDFIPGLPHLDVADGALNLMMRTYTDLLPTNGYLTTKRHLHLDAFEAFVRVLASNEPIVFERKRQRAMAGPSSRRQGAGQQESSAPGEYKREYYLEKLGQPPKDAEVLHDLVQSYLEGLSWCLAYYHDGCASWDWYYPDFYAPLATDLVSLPSFAITLELGAPFPPLAQLLSVLPPQSAQLVPAPYRELMLSPTSPVFDAYPKDFSIDLNGKRAEWEAIALLPFIDESRLLGATNAIDTSGVLSEAEQARNVLGEDLPYRNTAGAAWVGAEK